MDEKSNKMKKHLRNQRSIGESMAALNLDGAGAHDAPIQSWSDRPSLSALCAKGNSSMDRTEHPFVWAVSKQIEKFLKFSMTKQDLNEWRLFLMEVSPDIVAWN